jgi:hypothetical protein
MSKRSAAPTIRVTKIPRSDDWRVKRDGAQRSIAITDTQHQADEIARRVARNTGGAEVVTHGADGRIRSKDTIGRGDPLPPKDTEH